MGSGRVMLYFRCLDPNLTLLAKLISHRAVPTVQRPLGGLRVKALQSLQFVAFSPHPLLNTLHFSQFRSKYNITRPDPVSPPGKGGKSEESPLSPLQYAAFVDKKSTNHGLTPFQGAPFQGALTILLDNYWVNVRVPSERAKTNSKLSDADLRGT